MDRTTIDAIDPVVLSAGARRGWRALQVAVWVLGLAMVVAMVVAPQVGIDAMWNVLIPVAPAVLVFTPGLWRNICPLASTALFSRHLGLGRRAKIPGRWQGRLFLAGIGVLLVIVPLRHVLLDLSGPASATTLVLLAAVAITMGTVFEWKSGWCSALCPVHPVERLYGSHPVFTPQNAHCTECEVCCASCPDCESTGDPVQGRNGKLLQGLGLGFMPGFFPGFVWGWFQAPDYAGQAGWAHLASVYGYPFLAGGGTLAVFVLLRRALPRDRQAVLVRVFAAAAVSCYYWYRLPALVGFTPFPGSWVLVDLRAALPAWFPAASQAATTLLFGWWIVLRPAPGRVWLARPAYAARAERS